jgi:hypothetical protein
MSETSMQWDGEAAALSLRKGTLKGLRLAGEHILGLSRDRVPLEEGTLERSGLVTDDGEMTVAVSYDTPYAVRQHEDMTARHARGRTAKYLELAVAEGASDAARIVAAAAQKGA